jgi:hypothetical protein
LNVLVRELFNVQAPLCSCVVRFLTELRKIRNKVVWANFVELKMATRTKIEPDFLKNQGTVNISASLIHGFRAIGLDSGQ